MDVINLTLYWKGVENDPRMFYCWSSNDGQSWTDQKQVPVGSTSYGPALSVLGPHSETYMAWKGAGDDARMFYTSFGASWKDQRQVGGLTSHGPALATFTPRDAFVYLAWKGMGNDARMFYCSTSDGQNWTGERQVGGLTSHGPTITGLLGPPSVTPRMYLVWKSSVDQRMFYCSTSDGQNWTSDLRQIGGLTSDRPTFLAGGEFDAPDNGPG